MSAEGVEITKVNSSKGLLGVKIANSIPVCLTCRMLAPVLHDENIPLLHGDVVCIDLAIKRKPKKSRDRE
jgi:UDP-2,3-diacylglucosamine pyrophosphatase LpxH